MEEFGPLQIAPAGLLGLLQLKNNGRNPDTMSTMVQPIIELAELYRGFSRENKQTGQILAGIGSNAFDTFSDGTSARVPFNEYWWVDYISANTTALLNAGEAAQIMCGISVQQTAEALGVGPSVTVELNAADAAAGGALAFASNDRPFLMSPGDRFTVIVMREAAAAGFSVELQCRFARMRT